MERPKSAVRRPQSARRPPPSIAPAESPLQASGLLDADDDAHWLFSTAYRLTTTDIALAGFTTAILLDASRWKPNVEEELSPEDTAAAEIAYTFGFTEEMTPPTISRKHRSTVIAGLKKSFIGRGGDLLIIFQNTGYGEGTPLGDGEDAITAMNIVAMVLECINAAYCEAEDEAAEGLAGVSVVLEGFARTGMFRLSGNWDTGEGVDYEVQAFTDALPS